MSWNSAELGELCTFENGDRGKNYPGKSTLLKSGVPFVSAADLSGGHINQNGLSFISPDHYDRLGGGKFSRGDFLFCLRGSLGKFAFVDKDMRGAIASSLVIVRPSEELEPRYLAAYFNSNVCRQQIELFGNGAAQPNLSAASLKRFEIPLPPLEEQQRIASILDAADALRAKRRVALAKLDTLAQATFIEMFESREHKYVALSDYFDEIRMGPFGSLLHKSDYVDGGVPLINPMHIIGGELVPDPAFSIPKERAEELEIYRLRESDIVIGRRGEMGRCAVVREEQNGYLCGTGSMILRAASDKIDPYFLADLIRSKNVVKRIEAAATGVTMLNLNTKSFDRVLVPAISVDEQRDYFQRIRLVSGSRPAMLRSLARLDALFASLQHCAFRGELSAPPVEVAAT